MDTRDSVQLVVGKRCNSVLFSYSHSVQLERLYKNYYTGMSTMKQYDTSPMGNLVGFYPRLHVLTKYITSGNRLRDTQKPLYFCMYMLQSNYIRSQ